MLKFSSLAASFSPLWQPIPACLTLLQEEEEWEHMTGRRVAFLFGVWPTRDKMIKRLASATSRASQQPGQATQDVVPSMAHPLPLPLFGNDSAKLLMMITMWLDEWLFAPDQLESSRVECVRVVLLCSRCAGQQFNARGGRGDTEGAARRGRVGWLFGRLPEVLLLSSTLKFLKCTRNGCVPPNI